MADIDGALAALKGVLGSGAAPEWPQRAFGASVEPLRHWTGVASDSAHGASANLDTRRQTMAQAHTAVAALIAQADGVAVQSRANVDAVIDRWNADKNELASIANTSAGKSALLQRGAQRVEEAASVVRAAQDRYIALAGQVDSVTATLPERPGAGQVHLVEYDFKQAPPTREADRRRNQIEAFRAMFGHDPVSSTDWETAAALDPHSYDPKNQGVGPNIVVGRIEPVPGQGVVRTNLFIPSEDVWAPSIEAPPFDNDHKLPYDNNLGDNRGFDSGAGPEESRVAIYTDFENGIIVARQNPSVNTDTGQVRTGTPDISAVQQADGSVLINYNAADPFSPGGEGIAKGIPFSVNGTLGIAPGVDGPRVGGDVTTFPALEIYGDRGNTTTTLLQSWPSFTDDASGPMLGLLPHKDVGDPTIITSFNSVVPQFEPPSLTTPVGPRAAEITPPMTILPPGNFTNLGPATAAEAPVVRNYTPLQGTEFLPRP